MMRTLSVILPVLLTGILCFSSLGLAKETGIAYQNTESNYFHRKSEYFGRKSAYHKKSKNSNYFDNKSAYVNPKHVGYFRDNRSLLDKFVSGVKEVFTR